MRKVILLCGKVCSGKTTYAHKLKYSENAVVLGLDKISLLLFGENLEDLNDINRDKIERYNYELSVEIAKTGTTVILENGFWTKSERCDLKKYFIEKNIDVELHYLQISDEQWKKNIAYRNINPRNENGLSYTIDDNTMKHCENFFEAPDESENCVLVDLWR